MGLCASGMNPEEVKKNRELEEQNRKDAEEEAKKVKLLLLGAGESGKSTIFKQMRILYGVGFEESARLAMKPVIHGNVISSIQTLAEKAEELGFEVQNQDAAEEVLELPDDRELTPELGETIKTLWEDPGIQECYANRSRFQLNDSTEYYLNKVEEIAEPRYVPTYKDVLSSRVRTSGIIKENYVIDGVEFEMYDVGGQRNERRKWIHCFDGVTAIIFVAAISEYDQVLYEDVTVNRLDEAVQLWEEIYHNKWFRNTSFILFLNKKDLFEEKLKHVDIRHGGDDHHPARFTDYEHGMLSDDMDPETYQETFDKAVAYMEDLFMSCVDQESHPVYSHVTCATDTKNIETVFNACKEIVLRENIQGSGFMD